MRDARRRGSAGLGDLSRKPDALAHPHLDRRAFVVGAGALLAWPGPVRAAHHGDASHTPPAELLPVLGGSEFVYVSPLRSDGNESRCHGEVWYAWLDESVVLTTATKTWKAKALARGLDRARVWVGDHGRWKRPIGTNEAFRKGPSFVARASRSEDPALLDRLLGVYETKYSEEIGQWRQRMRDGHTDGSRILIRYRYESA